MKKYFWIFMAICMILPAGCGKSGDTVGDVSETGEYTSETVSAAQTTAQSETAEPPVGNTLMAKASPNTSALRFSVYDGENVRTLWLFDNRGEKDLLKRISEVPAEKAEDWSPELFEAPAYGFNIGDTDGWTLDAVWSNGYWITQDGEAYRFDYDFAAFEEDYGWRDESVSPAVAALPCAHIICRNGGEWLADRLAPAGAAEDVPDYISAELVSQTEDAVEVKYTNNGDEEWMYGLHFAAEVCLDGKWYSVPWTAENYVFPDIGLLLMPGQSDTQKYSFEMYGDLPEGQYRISANGCYVEFER
ncbi:MAG: hypothetical protein NC395_02895 [Prevotella sp.]|nr:hypothetical protein [Prevotella sp.]